MPRFYEMLCHGALSKSLTLLAMTILIFCSSPSLRSFTFGIDWSITFLTYHGLCPSKTIYWSICSLIKIYDQQIYLTNYLQHFENELSLELQVHIFNEDLDNSPQNMIFSCYTCLLIMLGNLTFTLNLN